MGKCFCQGLTDDDLEDLDACCEDGVCEAYKECDICKHCGAEMFEENGNMFHHEQRDIPYEERMLIHNREK